MNFSIFWNFCVAPCVFYSFLEKLIYWVHFALEFILENEIFILILFPIFYSKYFTKYKKVWYLYMYQIMNQKNILNFETYIKLIIPFETMEDKMSKKLFAYARKNIKSESIDEQINLIKAYCKNNNIELDERDFIIDDSENTFLREGYNALCSYMMRNGDALIISELDRLGRNVGAIKDEWIKLNDNGIELIIINNPLMSTYNKSSTEKDVIQKVVSELLVYMSEKEKAKIKRRQAQGIQALKEKNHGRGVGRPKTKVNKEFKVQYKLWKDGKQTAVQTFNNLGLTKATFYRLVKEYEQENND